MLRRFFWTSVLSLLITSSTSATPRTVSVQVCDEAGDVFLGAQVDLAPLLCNSNWIERALSRHFEPEVAEPEVAVASTANAAGWARAAFGQVLDFEGQPLGGVEVEVALAAGEAAGVDPVSASTDADGYFRIEMLPAERFDISVQKSGYAPTLVRGVAISTGQKSVDLGTLWLMPAVTLEGQVLDSEGRGIAEVEVWKISPQERNTKRLREAAAAVTGAAGRFYLGDLQEGSRIDLWIHRSGYLPKQLAGVEVPRSRPVSVVLRPSSEIRGRVIDREGQSLVGARVALREPEPPPGTVGVELRRGDGVRSVISDAEGRFVISDLSPGPAEIEPFLEEYESAPPKRLRLLPGEVIEGVTLVLRKGAVLEGRAVDENGEGVANARLDLGKEMAKSDATGYFRISGLATGRQLLVARHLGFDRYAEKISVAPGENQAEVMFVGGWPVRGQVVALGGAPILGAKVSLQLDRTSGELRRYQAESGPDGRFEVPRMVDGLYSLQVEAAGYGPPSQGETLRVHGKPLAGFAIELPLATRLVGTIFGLEFDELTKVRVEATQGHELRRSGTLDYQGAYEIGDLGPGIWLVRAFTPGGIRQAEARVTIDEEQEYVIQDLEFQGLTLSGEVIFDDAPLPQSVVSLTGHEVAVQRKVTTDYQGRFRLTDLPRGNYRLGVANGLHVLTHHQDVELLDDLDLPIEIATTRVEGLVVAASGRHPIAEALVYLEQFVGDGNVRPAALTTVATDLEGAFTLARLSAGRYRLTVRKDGYRPAEKILDLEPGIEREVALTLEATEGLDLLLLLPAGPRPLFAQVSVLDSSGQSVLSDTRPLNEEGRARFPTVPAGTWELVVGAPGLAVSRRGITLPGPALELALSVAARLEFRVPSLVEENLKGEFALLGVDGNPFLGLGPDGTPRRRWDLQAGVGSIGGLPAGLWTLSVLAVDGRAWQETVAISSGQVVQVVLE